MIRLALCTMIAIAGTTAAGDPVSPVKDAAEAFGAALLVTTDANGSGTLELDELEALALNLVKDMDADDSGDLTRAEMIAWRGGVHDIAAYRDRSVAHETMTSVLFDYADADADGLVSVEEQIAATIRIAAQADMDGDGLTTLREFDRHSIVAIGLRNAVKVTNP